MPAALSIVLAHDLSPSAARAAALLAHTPWPEGSTVRVVTSPAGVQPGLSSFAGLADVRAHDRERRASIDASQADIARALAEAGLVVETDVVRGRPASAVVGLAQRVGADLIVTGARSHGSLAATILGSVSAEIIEGAPCSVLIARGTSTARVLFATDGSPSAAAATDVLTRWPLFGTSRIRVVGIREAGLAYAGSELSPDELTAAYGDSLLTADRAVAALVATTAAALAPTHPDSETEIRSGDPAREIVAAAQAWAADLVVLGSDRAPARRGPWLGSVARQVLHGITSSALVVRPSRP